jgi:hypothetical protein
MLSALFNPLTNPVNEYLVNEWRVPLRDPGVLIILFNNEVAAAVIRVDAKDKVGAQGSDTASRRIHLRMNGKVCDLAVLLEVFGKGSVLGLMHVSKC